MFLVKRSFFIAAIACLCICTSAAWADVGHELIIKFKPGIAEQVKAGLAQKHGAVETRFFYRDRFRVLRLPVGANMPAVLDALARNPALDYVEPNRILRAFFMPNDEYYPFQWHLDFINMEAAWDMSTGSGVIVAVVDSGVSAKGSDGFGSRLLSGYNGFLNSTARWYDANSHGTHVAGTIAQETNNGAGVAGVAFNAQILPVKVLNRFGVGTSAAVAAGIRWATDNGAQVINMSLGDTQGSRTLKEAITYAYDNGVVIIAASGNNSGSDALMPVAYPAAYDEVIAVGAVDARGERAYYSNGGPELDLVAPGGSDRDDTGDGNPDRVLQETFRQYLGFSWFSIGWGYYYLMGTSMASPHVAGVAALIKSLHPDWGPEDIRDALTGSATDLGTAGRDDAYGYGLLDAAAAVAY